MPFDPPRRSRPAAVPQAPASLGPWQVYRTARRNVLELLPEAAFREPFVSRTSWPAWHMVVAPDLVEHVLRRHEPIYPRSDVSLRILRPNEGENIFVAYGASWRRQHKAMTPVFQHRAIAGVAPVMTAAAEAGAARLAVAAPGIVDVYPAMVTVTCDVICDAALSGREQLDRPGLTAAVSRYLGSVARLSLLDLVGAPDWLPRPARLLDRTGRAMDAMMDRIIAARRRRGPGDPPDVLDMMIAARDPATGASLSPLELRNNLLGFIIAGHETTALALTWALYLLAFDPAAQTRARDEARAVLGDRAAAAGDVPRLAFVRRVLDEAMRLYPPAGVLSRTAQDHDLIAGTLVRKGETVLVPVYALHRHRALWDEPDAFDPDRFGPETARARHRFAYLPFGAGPRICIGMAFALLEAVIVLATLVARFEFRLPPGFAPRPELTLTLRPASGMPLAIRRL